MYANDKARADRGLNGDGSGSDLQVEDRHGGSSGTETPEKIE
jgi:hypothetical protein